MVAILLTATTGVLGMIPLRLILLNYSQIHFGLAVVSIFAGLVASGSELLSLLWISSAGVSWLFYRLEKASFSTFWSGTMSLSFGSLSALFLFFGVIDNKTKEQVLSSVKTDFEGKVQTLGLEAIDWTLVVSQVPSGVFIVLLLSLFFSLIWQRPLSVLMGFEEREIGENWTEFRVPDSVVFAFIFSLLFGTVPIEGFEILQRIFLNVLNIVFIAYVLQGLAIVSFYFNYQRVAPIWRTAFYLVLIAQLQFSFILGFVGVADYWFDMRNRLRKRASEEKDI